MPQKKPSVDDWQDVNDWQDVSPSVPFGGRKPPASVQKFPTKELFGTMWGTDDSILPPIKGVTRPLLPEISPEAFARSGNLSGNPLTGSSPELNKWLYENVARPSSSVIGAASDWATGKVLGAVAKPIVSGASNLLKKFRGASEAIPPIRNVEAPIAELPPVKPELLDDSGRMVAPPQTELPVRPAGPWNENLPEIPIKPELNKPLPSLPIEEDESIGAYLRRNGVDNIHTTPDEQVVNRAAQVPDNGPVVPIKKDFDPASLGFEGAANKPKFRANLDGTFTNKSTQQIIDNTAKQFDEAEFVNPTTGEIVPESLAGQGDVPLNAPPSITDAKLPYESPSSNRLTIRELNEMPQTFGILDTTKPETRIRIDELKESLNRNGLVQPIEVNIRPDGSIDVGNGRHRIQALKELGITDVPVKYTDSKTGAHITPDRAYGIEDARVVSSIAGRSATKRMGSPDLGLTEASPELPVRQPHPETLNTNALSRPAMLPDEPWSPVGSLPDEQIPLMDVEPQIPFQPAGIPRPPTPYQPAGVPIRLGPPKPKAPRFGPEPPPPPIPPTPYQPAGIPKQLGPQPPRIPPMGPRKPPQPPANPLVPPPPPPQGPIRAALSTHKAWLTSLDLSAPGRQGKAFIFNKAWWTSLDDMGKAWWSKQGSDAVNDSIENHASGFFKQTQLPNGRKVQSWAEQMGLELPKHEEMFNSSAGKKFAEATGIEKSSRAHTAFLNKLRSDQFASMIKDSQAAGIDPIRNQSIAKAYAKFINDATGRGSLNFGSWKLERNMQTMNDLFFAPKNMSGQIRTWNNVLNPAKYYNYDPVLRKQALRSLFAIAGVGLGVGEVARLAGAQVSNDPTSADFRKIKIGDTRIDMFGGYQQFPVAAMKLLSGQSTSTISGKTTDLNAGRYGQQTRASVAERFFINRLSPVASFIYAWMNNSEFDGKPFEVKRALFERTFPIAAKDIMELAQEDPALAAIMAPSTALGLTGTQHYTGR